MNHHLFFAKRKYKKPSAFARLMRILANYKYFRSKGYGPRQSWLAAKNTL